MTMTMTDDGECCCCSRSPCDHCRCHHRRPRRIHRCSRRRRMVDMGVDFYRIHFCYLIDKAKNSLIKACKSPIGFSTSP